MRAKVSRQMVIDASVARSAGPETATFPVSKRCRDFLKTTLAVCHRCIFTPAISEEWKKHQSGFARTWRTAMVARKKLLFADVPEDEALRARVESIARTERAREAMLKDRGRRPRVAEQRCASACGASARGPEPKEIGRSGTGIVSGSSQAWPPSRIVRPSPLRSGQRIGIVLVPSSAPWSSKTCTVSSPRSSLRSVTYAHVRHDHDF